MIQLVAEDYNSALFAKAMLAVLTYPKRVPFPTQEEHYCEVHHQIHNAIDVLLPEHKVGNARDSKEVGNHSLEYTMAYDFIYFDGEIRNTLASLEDKEEKKSYVFATTATLLAHFQSDSMPGAVISNAIHDGLHDVLMDAYHQKLSPLVEQLRKIMRLCYYHYLAFGKTDVKCKKKYPYKNHALRKEDFDGLVFVAKQLETDIGIVSDYLISEWAREWKIL